MWRTVGVCLGVVGCGPSGPVQLVDSASFQAVSPGGPLAGEACSELAFSVEGGSVEIETEGCSPVAISTTLLEPVREGDTLEVVWWHDWLTAPEPTEGRLALYLDGQLLYEGVRGIPGEPAAFTEPFEARVGGSELVVRVENHGANTWNLLRLTRL